MFFKMNNIGWEDLIKVGKHVMWYTTLAAED